MKKIKKKLKKWDKVREEEKRTNRVDPKKYKVTKTEDAGGISQLVERIKK